MKPQHAGGDPPRKIAPGQAREYTTNVLRSGNGRQISVGRWLPPHWTLLKVKVLIANDNSLVIRIDRVR